MKGAREAPPPGERRAVTTRLSDVTPEDVEWVWRPYLPAGKLTLLEGDPGVGKTWLALAVTAAIASGSALPSEGVDRQPGNVLYVTAEDGLADTLRPRLDAMGADATKVHALKGWELLNADGELKEGTLTLSDRDVLDHALRSIEPDLVVVDPLQAFLGPGVDMHRANETRPLMATLAAVAEKGSCAVLVIRHLAKGAKDRAVHRGLGSIDFAAAARSILLVAEHPDEHATRVLAHTKSNLAEFGPSLAFEIAERTLRWSGEIDLTSEQLLAPRQTTSRRTATDEAVAFLRDRLAAGPQEAAYLREAAADEEISQKTLERAKAKLAIKSERHSTGNAGKGEWLWLPPS